MTVVKRGLGRGLDALIEAASTGATEGIQRVPIDAIGPNPRQPRHTLRADDLAELRRELAELRQRLEEQP